MSGGGGQSSAPAQTSSTQTSQPWSGQEPHLRFGYDEARAQYEGQKPQYFPGSTVVPFDPMTQAAQRMTINRATSPNSLMGSAEGQLQDTLGGQYQDLSGITNAMDARIRPLVGSQFAGSGRLGSPAYAGTYAEGLGNAIAPYAFQEYGNERNRQLQAAGMAPGISQAGYGDIDRLAGVGMEREAFARENLEDQINRHNFAQNRDAQKLAEFMGIVGGNSYGGTSSTTSTQPVYRGSGLLGSK